MCYHLSVFTSTYFTIGGGFLRADKTFRSGVVILSQHSSLINVESYVSETHLMYFDVSNGSNNDQFIMIVASFQVSVEMCVRILFIT